MPDDYIDQVKRKLEFLEQHPEWAITFVRSAGYHEAVREEANGIMVITGYPLEYVMNQIERLIKSERDAL
jgi:hypothetical protein